MQFRIQHVLAMMVAVTIAEGAWATCRVGGQLSRLATSPARCTQQQLDKLDTLLGNRLEFRASLDLPLAEKVLRERKCPSLEELQAFLDAWRRLPGTGFRYTAKKYCLTLPTYYGFQFPWPDKPLDDRAAGRLAEDIDRLRDELIPALAAKRSAVRTLVQAPPSAD